MLGSLHAKVLSANPTPFHQLLGRWAREGQLLRLYTQNIDGLENNVSGLETTLNLGMKSPWPNTIQLHGDVNFIRCIKCPYISKYESNLFDGGRFPECGQCLEEEKRRDQLGKRRRGLGFMRPRIVLYNEDNADAEAIGAITKHDAMKRSKADILIVIGTTLQIPDTQKMVKDFSKVVKRNKGQVVWINPLSEPPSAKDSRHVYDLVIRCSADYISGAIEADL
jgi:NAD-dependent histone deacetylase SIR2